MTLHALLATALTAALLVPGTQVRARTVVTLHVAPRGSDANPGTRSRPFATFERARDAVRALKRDGELGDRRVTIEVRAGIYELPKPLELTAEDSGNARAPVVWRSTKPGGARLVGGRFVHGWKRVSDPRVLARLDPAARSNVWQADLRTQGIVTNLPDPPGLGSADPGLEVFFNEQPMTIARWPNEGVEFIKAVEGGDYKHRDPKADPTPRFVFDSDRPEPWTEEPDIMLHGWWVWDWSDRRVRVKSFDPVKRIFTLDLPSLAMRKGQWFYAYNLLSELDRPGEWYVDRRSGVLYLWPPSPINPGRVMVSLIPSLVTLNEASYVTFRGFVLEACQGTAVTMSGGSNNLVAACTIRNTGGFGVNISGGTHNGVVGCDLYGLGDGGIALRGGDERSLTHCDTRQPTPITWIPGRYIGCHRL